MVVPPEPDRHSGAFTIKAMRAFDGDAMTGPVSVTVADGLIVAVEAARPNDGARAIVLPDDVVLAPGFIDLQVNGGGGTLLNDDPSVACVGRIAAAHRRFGTTGLLPTLITDAAEKMAELAMAAPAILAIPGVLGFHLEGPFINPARKGIHPEAHIRRPEPCDLDLLAQFGRLGRSMVTLAPEMTGPGFVAALSAAGLRVSLGHSDATSAEVLEALAQGASGVTHMFNAMSQLTPRQAGLVGTALVDPRVHAGLICDGLHVDPIAIRLAFRALGAERLMLVSDAMPSAGGDGGGFTLHGRAISLVEGRLTDAGGTLAGAHLTMIEAVRNAVELMGATLPEALTMASLTPARFLGFDDQLGRIAPGYRASLVAFDSHWRVARTWIDGA